MHGASRAGLWIAGLLSAAGVGLVRSTGAAVPGSSPARDPGPRRATPPPADPVPREPVPGLPANRPAATARGLRSRPRRRPDLVILADSPRRELPAALVRRMVPHLTASASEAIGVVGPLVLPGRSACLRCLDLARAERDPAWPLILAQLASRANAGSGRR